MPLYTLTVLDRGKPLYSPAVFTDLPPLEEMEKILEYGPKIFFNWFHHKAYKSIGLAFKKTGEVKKILALFADGVRRVEVVERGRLLQGIEQPLEANRVGYVDPSLYLYAIQHPADAVTLDGKPYYVVDRYDASRPRAVQAFIEEDGPELLRTLAEAARHLASKFSGLINCSKISSYSKRRWFYRFLDASKLAYAPAHDVGIILDEDWYRIDVQLEKSPLPPDEIYSIVDNIAAEYGGFWLISSIRGVHLVVPMDAARVVATHLHALKIYPDSTSVIPETYFRMPLSLHWRSLKPALMARLRYKDIVKFYTSFKITEHADLVVEFLSDARSLEELEDASMKLFREVVS